jgi:hypothetical protein
MFNDQANTQEFQTDPAGASILEGYYEGMTTEELKDRQLMHFQMFMAAVCSPMWEDLPPASLRDMCHLVVEIHDTMRGCQEVYNIINS